MHDAELRELRVMLQVNRERAAESAREVGRLKAEVERLQAEVDAAIDLLEDPSRFKQASVPRAGKYQFGYRLDGVWAGETMRDVVRKAADAAEGGEA